MRLTGHGGSCCGMRHVYSFGYPGEAEIAELKRLARGSRLCEVVLTDTQIQYNVVRGETDKTWPEALKELGFHLVNRFRNPNTRNFCNVFHRTGGGYKMTPPPFEPF